MIKRCLTSLVATLIVCFLACSSASARVCFLPDSTDCGEGDVVGSSNVDVPCQYSNCPAYNTKYQTCYTERIYNNGGVNVECKQVKCILSKSECEKQEANPNSSQCCNFDRDSGCYYMGSCKLCNRDVYDSEKNLGEGYNCYPCKDKNGTFYNCTAKEKECSQINPNYTSKCGDSQIAKEVEGIKDSHGNQCYTCEDKPVDKNCKIKGGCIIDMASIGHNSGHGTIGTGDNTEITYTCYITKAENATEADLQKIYGIMYSDFNCQSSMGQIMSSGYQRVGGVINLSSSPVSGKFTVGELTRLANCQGNTAEYNWDTKIELYNGTDHCNFTEEIFTKTCKQLGYINKNNNCSSNNLVKTLVENVIGTDGQCYKCEKSKVTITIILDATNTTVNFSSFSSDNKGYTVKLSLNGGGNDGITYPVTVTEGRTATYFSSTYEPGDCDVYGDNCDNDLGNGRETVSAASNLSVIINDQTVLNNLTTENEYLDMRYFIGKTYDTDNYIIKFVKEKTCTPTCTSETGCKYGSKTQSDGCGGTCTVCYPPCAIGYWYGSLAQENCYIKPAKYIKQPSNPHCSKCVCDNGKPDANGHYLQCQYF